MDRSERIEILKNAFPFWEHLSEEDKETLCRSSHAVQFKKGTNVHDGNECTGVILVRTGSLRLYMLSEDGKEITLYRIFPGDMCMLSASCVLNSITFDVFVDSEENSECIVVGGCAFADISARVPEAKIFALEAAVSRFSDVMWIMQQIVFMSMDKRLAIFLLEETQANGTDSVNMTHETIARHLGTAREVVTRMLKHLAADGVIEVTRKGILITDKKKLRSIAY